MDADEIDELLGVMDDARGFLRRRDGLPHYIARAHIVRELARAAAADGLNRDRRAEAVDLAWRMVEQAKHRKEGAECLEIVSCLLFLSFQGLAYKTTRLMVCT